MNARATLATLATAPIVRTGPMPEGINADSAYRAEVGGISAVVKHDATHSRTKSEVAAYTLASLFPGLVNVPPTVLRDDATGRVSVQEWIADASYTRSWASVTRSDILGLATFDYIISNPDRHFHNFIQSGSRLYAIDHGLAFTSYTPRAASPATRVEGLRIPSYIHSHLADRLLSDVSIAYRALAPYLRESEVTRIIERAQDLHSRTHFPRARLDVMNVLFGGRIGR